MKIYRRSSETQLRSVRDVIIPLVAIHSEKYFFSQIFFHYHSYQGFFHCVQVTTVSVACDWVLLSRNWGMKVWICSEIWNRRKNILFPPSSEPNGFIFKKFSIRLTVQLIDFIIFWILSFGSFHVKCLPLPGKRIRWTWSYFLLILVTFRKSIKREENLGGLRLTRHQFIHSIFIHIWSSTNMSPESDSLTITNRSSPIVSRYGRVERDLVFLHSDEFFDTISTIMLHSTRPQMLRQTEKSPSRQWFFVAMPV